LRIAAEKPSALRLPEGVRGAFARMLSSRIPPGYVSPQKTHRNFCRSGLFRFWQKLFLSARPRSVPSRENYPAKRRSTNCPGPPLSDAKYIPVIKIVKYDGRATHFTIRYCPSANRNSSFDKEECSPLDSSTSIVKPPIKPRTDRM